MLDQDFERFVEQQLVESAFSLQGVVDKLLPKFFENDDRFLALVGLITKFAPSVLPNGLPVLVEKMRDPESSGLTKVILNTLYSIIAISLLALISSANGIEIVKKALARTAAIFKNMAEIISLSFKSVPNKIILFLDTLSAFDKAIKTNAFNSFAGTIDTLVNVAVNSITALDEAYKSEEFYDNMSIITKMKMSKYVIVLAKDGYFLGKVVNSVMKNANSMAGLRSMLANLSGNLAGKR